MKKYQQTLLILICFLAFSPSITLIAQDSTLPYAEIPDAPKKYNACTVAARMVDGLGFRYYWATEGLRPEDLAFRPSEDSRSVEEILDHIYGLSLTIVNAPQSKPNVRPIDNQPQSFEEKRAATLDNFQKASQLLKAGGPNAMADYKVIFERDGNQSEFPFWNMINGPIADALWHAGQVMTLRRVSGNPINPKVSVFNGKLRE